MVRAGGLWKRGRGRRSSCLSRDPLGGWLKPGIPGRSRRQDQDRSRVPRKCGGTITKLCRIPKDRSWPEPVTIQAAPEPCFMEVRQRITWELRFTVRPPSCMLSIKGSPSSSVRDPATFIATSVRSRGLCASCSVRVQRGGREVRRDIGWKTIERTSGSSRSSNDVPTSGTRATAWPSEHPHENPASGQRSHSGEPLSSSGSGTAVPRGGFAGRCSLTRIRLAARSSVRG